MEKDYPLYDAIVSESIYCLHEKDEPYLMIKVKPHDKIDLFCVKMAIYTKLLHNKSEVYIKTPLWYYFSKELKFARKDAKFKFTLIKENVRSTIEFIAKLYSNSITIINDIYEEYYND